MCISTQNGLRNFIAIVWNSGQQDHRIPVPLHGTCGLKKIHVTGMLQDQVTFSQLAAHVWPQKVNPSCFEHVATLSSNVKINPSRFDHLDGLPRCRSCTLTLKHWQVHWISKPKSLDIKPFEQYPLLNLENFSALSALEPIATDGYRCPLERNQDWLTIYP